VEGELREARSRGYEEGVREREMGGKEREGKEVGGDAVAGVSGSRLN
jgi:hypothetical protein